MVINYHKLADQFLEGQTVPLKVIEMMELRSESVRIEAISFLSALRHASDPNKVLEFYMQNDILEKLFGILQDSKR